MNTPICDFVRAYRQRDPMRLHMPGHKGVTHLGMEALDITEIDGADSLYEAAGVIAQSEQNASQLFGCPTFYSTEGASQCIRAMLYLARLRALEKGIPPRIAAVRNAHKTFLTAAAMLDLPVDWLYAKTQTSYLSCALTPEALEQYLTTAAQMPSAVYLTSPDYLGQIADIRGLAEICHRHGVLLLVDNAHGAYLKFLPQSIHPMDLGADLCCDSAHKTLPVLTGGAYLHLAPQLGDEMLRSAKRALSFFGSTSPSYLILQSLDGANPYLETCSKVYEACLPKVEALKAALQSHGYRLYGSEPMKLTIEAKAYGYTGQQLSTLLQAQEIQPEFSDPDYLVLMLTPEIAEEKLQRLQQVLLQIPRKRPILQGPPVFSPAETVLSIRQAMLAPSEALPAEQCLGRIIAEPGVGCPPAVPILVCGERITSHTLDCFAYYGICQCCVVKA